VARNPLSEELLRMDRQILCSSSLSELLAWERDIAREYQLHPWPDYVAGRCHFLRENGLSELAGYVESKRPRIGIYAGSFDPFHQGHLEILLRAEELFDKVIVAVGINPDKNAGTVEDRLDAVRESLPFHEVRGFVGLLTELVEEIGSYADAAVVRGLRDGYDLQQEINQARFLEDLSPQVRTVWIPCDRRSQHISSTAIRALRKFGSPAAASYLPDRFSYAHSIGQR
jgi:pantetheine-phosphate adenylyltransferase